MGSVMLGLDLDKIKVIRMDIFASVITYLI